MTDQTPASSAVRELLENSYRITQGNHGEDLSRLSFLADHIFDFTTYDSEMSELFGRKAVEVCTAITHDQTFEYIKDAENYRWFLLMVNMPFFAPRLEWGTSVRGAWWDHGVQALTSCGIWRGEDQLTSLEFTREEWIIFMVAVIEFSEIGDTT